MKLLGKRRSERQRPKRRAGTDRDEALLFGCFTNAHDIQSGPGIWAKGGAYKRDRQLGTVEYRATLATVGRDIFGGCKVSADPLQRDADQFAALDLLKTAISVRKPLRRKIGQRR